MFFFTVNFGDSLSILFFLFLKLHPAVEAQGQMKWAKKN